MAGRARNLAIARFQIEGGRLPLLLGEAVVVRGDNLENVGAGKDVVGLVMVWIGWWNLVVVWGWNVNEVTQNPLSAHSPINSHRYVADNDLTLQEEPHATIASLRFHDVDAG